jgi:SNW domain-containing protein 1
MASFASTLSKSLPKPKYSGGAESGRAEALAVGPRILGPESLDQTQLVLAVCATSILLFSEFLNKLTVQQRTGPPAYGKRSGWRPRRPEDFGDGGAFPEIPIAQYPMDMGRKTGTTSNALALQVDAEGKIKYDAIARQGHNDSRIVHTSFKDLIPLRQRADVGEISLARPSQEEVAAQTEKTKEALAALITGASVAQNPKNIKAKNRAEPTYVRYTPSDQMGDKSRKNDRIMKIVERQQDPLEPPKFKHKKIPRGPPSPPPPVMHSPPRKLTAADQEMWRIPPSVSNWKNPRGYTVPLDKRLAADGRGLQDVVINDKFAQFAEALFTTDRHAREEIAQRQLMQQRLAEKEKAAKEESLRKLAEQAREERSGRAAASARRASRSSSRSSSRSRSAHSDRRSGSDSEDDAKARDRRRIREENRKEDERKQRQNRMGAERRLQVVAREQDRDISEKIALGIAKPTKQSESMYDSRLFNQTSGFAAGFNEDQPYDKPLFADRDALGSIYRSKVGQDEFDDDAGAGELDSITKQKRFEVLGQAQRGFKGASEAEERDGPVRFEKSSTTDPFNVDKFLNEVAKDSNESPGQKRNGIQDTQERSSKRARVEDDSS